MRLDPARRPHDLRRKKPLGRRQEDPRAIPSSRIGATADLLAVRSSVAVRVPAAWMRLVIELLPM